MWFSPLKGAHLTLGQLDKTLPVDLEATATVGSESNVKLNKTIERGIFVFVKAGANGTDAPRFQRYTATEAAKPNAVPYIALMGVNDWQAGMAGNIGQAESAGTAGLTTPSDAAVEFLNKTQVDGAQSFRGPRITAISIVQPAEYQTTAFESSNNESYYVGCPLTISNNGKLTPFSSGKNIVGYVTAMPKTRWINDLGADNAASRITGGNAKVLEFSTAWIPVAAAGQPGTSGAGATPGALNVGAPKVQAEAKGNEAPKAK